MGFTIDPIGVISTPYQEKFGVPRQPGLVTAAEGWLELLPEFSKREMLRGLEEFSHVWLLFIFHEAMEQGWQPTVRPPRLGGNIRQGVFATRSPFRPNPLGLSRAELLGIEERHGKLGLRLGGIDLVDATPIIDIKPYLPYVDAVPEATGGRFQNKPLAQLEVAFSPDAEAQVGWQKRQHPQLKELITQVLQQDPRPAYQKSEAKRIYGISLYNLNIRWQIEGETARVLEVLPDGKN
ncbi:MAG TPA: tRNA (N6-threonylcarbamoyladenosine(37)-N6)-methyltransferase TrmO [Geothermobacteraceae bacterium]|nr:tRNA (N6-threonylcarbamoyladenosine(37)-N6)-methyltransferase TrmO [Geothermobacteraceae bacterium]